MPKGISNTAEHLGVSYELIFYTPPPNDPLAEVLTIGWKFWHDGKKYGDWLPCPNFSQPFIDVAHEGAKRDIEECLKA